MIRLKQNINKTKLFSLLLSIAFVLILSMNLVNVTFQGNVAHAADLHSQQYELLATAIDASNVNSYDKNENPAIFDATNPNFINAIEARLDSNTTPYTITASSAAEFSREYATRFAGSLDIGLDVYAINTNISAKFDIASSVQTYEQQIENYEYYYWFAKKYVVNVDWAADGLSDALTARFSRDLTKVDSVESARQLLQTYGSHVFSNYTLGGRLAVTKYYRQDATYTLSETEQNLDVSLNAIVDAAKASAKLSGSASLSEYERDAASGSRVYSKLSYEAIGGVISTALSAADLFQYKTQFGTGGDSGFLYEAWTGSFDSDDANLAIISNKNAVAIWDILDKGEYASQIVYMKQAFDSMCFENYASKCNEMEIPCSYFDITTNNGLSTVDTTSLQIALPEGTVATVNASKLITDSLSADDYEIKLSQTDAATLTDNILTINANTTGKQFDIQLWVNGLLSYKLNVSVGENYSQGSGTTQDPYIISTAAQLSALLSTPTDRYYKLANDIDMRGRLVESGGAGSATAFAGTLDGNGYTISNFTIYASDFNHNGFYYVGLFGRNEGVIKNLTLDHVVCLIDGLVMVNDNGVTLSVGILTGHNAGTISDCIVTNSAVRVAGSIVEDATLNVGGIAGYSESVIEYSAFTDGKVYGIATDGKGTVNVGGIVGMMCGALVTDCYVSRSQISATNNGKTSYNLGGIVGNITTAIDLSLSTTKSTLTRCLIYNVTLNQLSGKTSGYIAGIAPDDTEFFACYYAEAKKIAVGGSDRTGCTRLDAGGMNLEALHNNDFAKDWMDGQDGPILKTHSNRGGK